LKVRIGYSAWIVGVVQFFVVHGIAESAWARPYSWARNNISDLGNAHCAMQSEPEPRYICSPEHDLMSGAFITLGVLLVVGVALTGGVLWRRGRTAAVARLLLAGAGVGFVLAGLAPADVNENQHILGAFLIMLSGCSSPTTISVSAWEAWSGSPRFLSCFGLWLSAFAASFVVRVVCTRRRLRDISAALVESPGRS
jgi:hypothetical membrane protein